METVVCPGCGEENPAKFKLCGYCGTSLAPLPETVICPSCGEENPSKFRLCGYCGTALGTSAPLAVAPTPPPVVAPAPAPELPPTEVRKFVTLVFTDLKDSTALTASIDAEAMNEIKARYFREMAGEIERHGGNVEKNIGDAIMAVFGRIRASEDDALRGVRAAAGMITKLHELNDEFERYYGVRLTVRTGVNTGEVVASTDEHATMNLATGDAVNVAARLEQNAPANEVLIGELSYALVRDHIDAERVELTLKGKAEPVTAYRLIAVRASTATSVHEEAPFVGRQYEMDLLSGSFAQVVDGKNARLVTVIGDAGVGKTRLIADFQRRASDRATVLRGRCLAYGDGITFWPLTEITRAAARISEEDSSETATAKIRELLPDDADRATIVERVAAAVGLSNASFPVAELFWGARKLIESQAVERPLVLVIDDIHSAEETFLEFLEHLVESVRDRSILIICSARPELLDEHADWTDQTSVERIDLQPLGSDDVEAMIDRLLGESELSIETRARVVEAAEGNPLYIEQIVSMVKDQPGSEIVVPPTISALLAARLDNLTREERAVVEPASVIGLVFPELAVEDMVPTTLRSSVPDHLSHLDRKQFVHPLVGEDDPAFRFHHILVRDAAYQSLLKRARANLHERFVAWAEPVNRERGRETEFEEILGYHLEQAVRYRSELGPLDVAGMEVAARASRKLASAGRRAFARGDTPAACNLLRRAAALLSADDPVRIELLTDLTEALGEEGQSDEALVSIQEAIEAAERLGDARLVDWARLSLRGLEVTTSGAAESAEVIADTERAIAAFEASGDEAGLAKGWRLLSFVHGTAGAYDRAAEAAERAARYARSAGDIRLATRGSIGYAVSALHGTTPVDDATVTCLRLAEEVRGDRVAEAVILGVLGQLHAMAGAFDEARDAAARGLAMLNELGPSISGASTSIESSRIETLAGNPAAAEAALKRDFAALEALGETYYRASIAGLLAHTLVESGDLDGAERVIAVAREIGDPDDIEVQILWRSAEARVLAMGGNPSDEAVALAVEAVDLASSTVDLILHADALAVLAEVLEAAGRAPEAAEARARALALYDQKGSRAGRARLLRQPIEAISVT